MSNISVSERSQVGFGNTNPIIRSGIPQQPTGIVFIAGQSNAVGQGNASSIGGGLIQPDSNISLFQQTAPAGSTPVFNINYYGDLGPYAATSPNMGCELSLAKTLFAIYNSKTTIGKFGQSETNLAVDWDPTGTYPSPGPNLFQQLVTYINNLKTFTGQPLQAFVWIQGESDATDDTFSASYGANLSAFMRALQTQAIDTTTPIIIVQLNTQMGFDALPPANVAIIQAAQAAYVASNPNSALVVTNDLTSVSGDDVDYNAADLVTIGNRCAVAIAPFIKATPAVIGRDTTSLKFWPRNNSQWKTFLAGLPGDPQPPLVNYNFDTLSGADANGIQNLTVGSGWASVPPTGWTENAMTSADGNSNAIYSTTGPIGNPSESQLLIGLVLFTGLPSARHDVFGCNGSTGYRGVTISNVGGVPEVGLLDLSGGNSPVGTASYGIGIMHAFALQVNLTGRITQVVTDREVIAQSPYNAPAITSDLLAIGAAATETGPIAVKKLGGWAGPSSEMSIATIQGIIARINAFVRAR